MTEKVATMVIKADLQCPCCYKKIKKILCKYPQIRDQVYDEKGNTVTVTVMCCPEKIRDKLFYRGGKVIKSIEIKDPAKPKEPEKKKGPEKPKEPEKPKVVVVEKPKEPEKPKVVVVEKPKEPEKPKKVVVVEPEKPKADGGKPQDKPKDDPPKAKGPEQAAKPPPPEPMKLLAANPVNGFPPVLPPMACYGPSYDGFSGGAPWYDGYGVPPPPQPTFDGYYGYGYGYPYGRGYNPTRVDSYFSDENPSACTIM